MSETFETAERAFFTEQGLKVSVRELGWGSHGGLVRVLETGEGPPLVYLHGGGGYAAQWAPLVARLPGYRHVLVNRPGCGGSTDFDYRGVDLRGHAREVIDGVFDVLGLDRVVLVGGSMGGLWSLWYALDRPARVTRLALLGAPAGLLDSSVPLGFRLQGVRGLSRMLFAVQPPSRANAKRVLRMVYGSKAAEKIPASYRELEYQAGRVPGARDSFRTLLEQAVRLPGMRAGVGVGPEELIVVRQPTLFVWGDQDVFAPPDVGRQACSLMPGARFETVVGGHAPWWDEPDQCARWVGTFLVEETRMP